MGLSSVGVNKEYKGALDPALEVTDDDGDLRYGIAWKNDFLKQNKKCILLTPILRNARKGVLSQYFAFQIFVSSILSDFFFI